MKKFLQVLCFWILQISLTHSGPPRVETRPNLSDSYVPALMQIIAHDTELMKYEIKPTQQSSTTTKPPTSTTKRSTPAHMPGVFQPAFPPPKPVNTINQGFPQNTKVTINPFAPSFTYSYYPIVPGVVGFIPFQPGVVINKGYSSPVEQNLLGVPSYDLGQNAAYLGQNGGYLERNGQIFGQANHHGNYIIGPNGQFLTPYLGQTINPFFGRSLNLDQNKDTKKRQINDLKTKTFDLNTQNNKEIISNKKLETRSLRKSEQEQISQLAKNLRLSEEEQVDRNVETYLGKGFSDVFRLANRIDTDYEEEAKFLQFSKNFDDVDFGLELLKQLRQKRIPPTKAYVTLLNIYDELNKELKRLGFNKFTGYNQAVLSNLVESSKKNSAYQLRFILQKTVDNQDLKNPTIVTKLKNLLQDFEQDDSYIYKALGDIPPLIFSN